MGERQGLRLSAWAAFQKAPFDLLQDQQAGRPGLRYIRGAMTLVSTSLFQHFSPTDYSEHSHTRSPSLWMRGIMIRKPHKRKLDNHNGEGDKAEKSAWDLVDSPNSRMFDAGV